MANPLPRRTNAHGETQLWYPTRAGNPTDRSIYVAIVGSEGDDVAFVNVKNCANAKVQHLSPREFLAAYSPVSRSAEHG